MIQENTKELFEAFGELMSQTKGKRNVFLGEKKIMYIIGEVKGGKVTAKELAKEVQVSTARVARALNSLEKKEMIIRTIDENDKRRTIISLTEKGQKELIKEKQRIMNKVQYFVDYLGEHDSKELARIIKKLAKIDHAHDKKGS